MAGLAILLFRKHDTQDCRINIRHADLGYPGNIRDALFWRFRTDTIALTQNRVADCHLSRQICGRSSRRQLHGTTGFAAVADHARNGSGYIPDGKSCLFLRAAPQLYQGSRCRCRRRSGAGADSGQLSDDSIDIAVDQMTECQCTGKLFPGCSGMFCGDAQRNRQCQALAASPG